MGKDKGRDRSQDRRLLECTECGQQFYSYRVTKKAECPNCQTPTAREVQDDNIEDNGLPAAGRFSEREGAGACSGCIGPIILLLLVLAAAYGVYHFRDAIGARLGLTGNEVTNAPENAPGLPDVETIHNAPTNDPLDVDVPEEEE
jgi:hypothetical protein